MHKPAKSDHPVHALIQNRWSPRAFSEKPVTHEVLRSLFEAARWAPSSYNEQPWAFIVGTKQDKETFEKVLSTLVEFNQGWAKHAAVLGIAVAEQEFARNNQPNRNAAYDTGAAMAYLTTEATALDLFVHQMAGFEPKKAAEVFHIPQGWEPIAAFAIGYAGEADTLPEHLKESELGPRSRKPISEFVMAGKWGHPADFLSK
jgi:nitroreductase